MRLRRTLGVLTSIPAARFVQEVMAPPLQRILGVTTPVVYSFRSFMGSLTVA